MVGFIFLKGILTRYYRLVAPSLSVIIVYGGMCGLFFLKYDDTFRGGALIWFNYWFFVCHILKISLP
jgi:hypothetical protein